MDSYLIFVLLSLLCSIRGDNATLTVVPGSTVSLYTSVTYTCDGVGDSLLWLVGPAPLTDAIKQQRAISVTDSHSGSNLSSVLTIPAIPVNDRVEIGCWIDLISVGSSQLVVTGVSPVEDLHIGFTSDDSLNLTWSPPVFYSTDVPFGSTFHYQVLITNETGDPIVDTTVSNTSLILANITKCDTFNVSVTASVVAQYTSVSNSDRNNGSYSIQIGKPLLKFSLVTQSPVLTMPFNVTSAPSLCNSTVVIELSCDGCIKSAHLEINGSNDDNLVTKNHTIVDLESFKHYEITLSVMDRKNLTRDQANVAISTYHVQNVTIDSQQYTNGSVRVKCLFIEASTADGCHVIFTSTTDQAIELQAFNITGSNERIVTLSVSSNYTVTAYDLVNGTIIGPSVEYSTPVEVIILPIPPPVSATSSISSTMIPVTTSQATTVTVSTASDVSTEPRPTLQSTDGKQQHLAIISGSTVGGILVATVLMITILIGVMFVRMNNRKQSVTLHGEMAMTHNAQADQNDYTLNLPVTAIASGHSQMIVASGSFNGTDRLTQITQENPYHLTREDWFDRRESSNSANSTVPLLENDTSPPNSVESSLNISLHDEVQSNSAATGTTVNGNMSTYADLATVTKESAPCKPPSAVQPVTYSKVPPHTNKRVNSVHPAAYESSDDPPPKYENLDHFTRQSEEATETYHYFVEPSVSFSTEEDHCFVYGKSKLPQSPEQDNAARGALTNEDLIVQSCSYCVSPYMYTEETFTDKESMERERYFANEEIVEAIQGSNTCKVEGQVSSSHYTVLSTDGASNDTEDEIQQDIQLCKTSFMWSNN